MSLFITRAGLTAFGAAAAVSVLMAPNAHAAVDSVTVSGTNHAINTEYTLTAKLSGVSIGLLVYWTDNNEAITGAKVPWPIGESTITWTPTVKGQHVITASQGGSTKTVVVNVIDPADEVDPGEPGGSGSAATFPGLGGLFGSS